MTSTSAKLKLAPPLPPRTSKGVQLEKPESRSVFLETGSLQPPEESSSNESKTESPLPPSESSKTDSQEIRLAAAAPPPTRPPRPANFTVPDIMKPKSKEEDAAMLSRLAAPKSADPSTVAYGRAERATKFTYNAEAGKWEMKTTKVRICAESFSEGGMRLAHRAVEMDGEPFVVKLFKDASTKPAVVFHEALTQAVSEKYATGFNNLCERKGIMLRLRFLPVWVLHLTQRSKVVKGKHVDLYATMEPYLPGKYVKLSDNSGRHLNDIPAQAAQTFSHYSFLASGRRLVCVDIQGVSELAQEGDSSFTAKNLALTDPQIHSLDGNQFGAGNLGVKGINAFITSYKRTMFDEQLGLAHLTNSHLLEEPKREGEAASKLPEKVDAPPFDTAELASILAADERAKMGGEDEFDAEPKEPTRNLDDLLGDEEKLRSRNRSSVRVSDFSKGGELFRLSMYARDLTGSITEIV